MADDARYDPSTNPWHRPAKGSPGRPRSAQRALGNTARADVLPRWEQCIALLSLATRHRVAGPELAARLNDQMPWRTTKFNPSILSRIRSGVRSLRLEDVDAMAQVLATEEVEVDPGWIAFGDRTTAEAPDPTLLRRAMREYPPDAVVP